MEELQTIRDKLHEKESLEEKLAPLSEKLKEVKKPVDEIKKQIDSIDAFLEAFADEVLTQTETVWQKEDIIVSAEFKAKKKIKLLEVLKCDEARKTLINALETGKCSGSITIAFDKELMGFDNYNELVDTTGDRKVKVDFFKKGGK